MFPWIMDPDTASVTSVFCIFFSSSSSTKLTVDMGSLQSVCTASAHSMQPGPATTYNNTCPSYSRLPTTSYCTTADDKQDGTLTAEEATQYLELSSKPERCR